MHYLLISLVCLLFNWTPADASTRMRPPRFPAFSCEILLGLPAQMTEAMAVLDDQFARHVFTLVKINSDLKPNAFRVMGWPVVEFEEYTRAELAVPGSDEPRGMALELRLRDGTNIPFADFSYPPLYIWPEVNWGWSEILSTPHSTIMLAELSPELPRKKPAPLGGYLGQIDEVEIFLLLQEGPRKGRFVTLGLDIPCDRVIHYVEPATKTSAGPSFVRRSGGVLCRVPVATFYNH